MSVFPVEEAVVVPGATVNVPLPSAANVVTLGELARFVAVPVGVDFSCVVNVAAPVAGGATGPGPPDPFEPYVIAQVKPPTSVTPVTWIVWLEMPTVPQVDVVKPAAEPVVEGADQPAGTVRFNWPLLMPPTGAWYVNVRALFADELALAELGTTVIVPVPSAAYTVTDGEFAIDVSAPPDVDFSCIVNVVAPVAEGATGPGPPEAVEPYVIVQVKPPTSVTAVTWIVWPEVPTVPQVDVVKPAAEPVVDGADQPAGTVTFSWPPLMPPTKAW